MENYSRQCIEEKLVAAIGCLLKNDLFLLENNVNERSLAHKLAEYLQVQFQEWHVDCEYNRHNDQVKRLDLPKKEARIDSLEAKTVFPDIIVHRRSTNDNLLVIEIKKDENSSLEKDDFDRTKLEAFVRPRFNYQHGLFLKFSTNGRYSCEWFPKAESAA